MQKDPHGSKTTCATFPLFGASEIKLILLVSSCAAQNRSFSFQTLKFLNLVDMPKLKSNVNMCTMPVMMNQSHWQPATSQMMISRCASLLNNWCSLIPTKHVHRVNPIARMGHQCIIGFNCSHFLKSEVTIMLKDVACLPQFGKKCLTQKDQAHMNRSPKISSCLNPNFQTLIWFQFESISACTASIVCNWPAFFWGHAMCLFNGCETSIVAPFVLKSFCSLFHFHQNVNQS